MAIPRFKPEPCPFIGQPCEYVPMAHQMVKLEKEIERLRKNCFGYPALMDHLPHETLMALHDHIHTIIDERNRGKISKAREDKAKKARAALKGTE